jgi:hypothetical protein
MSDDPITISDSGPDVIIDEQPEPLYQYDWSRAHSGDQGERQFATDGKSIQRSIAYWPHGTPLHKGYLGRTTIFDRALDSFITPTVYILRDSKAGKFLPRKITNTYTQRRKKNNTRSWERTVTFKNFEKGANYFGFNFKTVEITSWGHLEQVISDIGMENVDGTTREVDGLYRGRDRGGIAHLILAGRGGDKTFQFGGDNLANDRVSIVLHRILEKLKYKLEERAEVHLVGCEGENSGMNRLMRELFKLSRISILQNKVHVHPPNVRLANLKIKTMKSTYVTSLDVSYDYGAPPDDDGEPPIKTEVEWDDWNRAHRRRIPESQSPTTPPTQSPPRARTLAETYPKQAHLFNGAYQLGMPPSQSPPQMAQSRDSQSGYGYKERQPHFFNPYYAYYPN